MTMRNHLRTAVLSIAAGGALSALGLLFGPAGSASAAERDIHLEATSGTTALPGNGTSATVGVWGYCLRSDPTVACGPVTAPGGPVLTVDAGDVVHLTLHNTLPEATSLYVGGQAMVPDTVGAAAGSEKTYTFTASRPGTYLYEAGLTANAQHQVALGLYGALVVRPATAGQAYDASTTFDRESVLVLSEIDPALNGSADPAAFDMRAFNPRWFLINGKVHPSTDPVPASSGETVLLRYVNAGSLYHSMAVLGADQHVVALDGSQLVNGTTDISRRYVAETFGPGQTADALVTVPTTTTDRRLAVYDSSLSLHNTNAPGVGGMLTFLAVTGAGTASDTTGPATTGVGWATDTLTATISDAATGGANIQAAEYYLDSISATPTAMSPVDAFDSPTEAVTASAPIVSGKHVLYVRGQDALGNWGSFSSVLVIGADDQGPTTSGVSLTPDRTNGGTDVAVSATGNDSASGNSAIAAAEWAIDGGAGTSMSVTTSGAVASVDGTIPQATLSTLTEGTHTVSVRTQDAAGNWGLPADALLVIDTTAPTATDVTVAPNPNNGTTPINGSTPAVRLSATLNDPASTTGGAQSAIAKGEAFIDAVGPLGSGIPLEASDGAFSSPMENVYTDIPLTTVKAMSDGNHTLSVRGKDAAGNWGALSTTTLTVDKTGPAITGLSLTPNPTDGATQTTLSGTVQDALSGVASVEWFIGADPGVGKGTAVMPAADGTFSATVNLSPYAEGNYIVTVRALDTLGNRSSATTALHLTPLLWFSTSGSATVPGVSGTADDADIYNWTGSRFGRSIDASGTGSLLGLPGNANVDGFSRVDATHFYLSFTAAVTLPGIAAQVQDEDVVYYNAGTWSLFFDGSSYGLGGTTGSTAFDLDAISVRSGALYFSTDTNNLPPGAGGTADDSDVYRWNGGSSYTRVVDATVDGVPASANVDGFVWRSSTDYLMSFTADTTLTGPLAVQDEDVVRRSGGTWTVYFDGTAAGLTNSNLDVDAFDIP